MKRVIFCTFFKHSNSAVKNWKIAVNSLASISIKNVKFNEVSFRVYRFSKKRKLGCIFLAITKNYFHFNIEASSLLLAVCSMYFKFTFFLQMVITIKIAPCWRYRKHHARCSRLIRWYRVYKIAKVLITTELEDSAENIILWTSPIVCVSRNWRCIAKRKRN